MSYFSKDSGYKLYMTGDVATKLWTYIDSLSDEVGGFGYVFRNDEKQEWMWQDIFLVDQEVSGSEVVYSADSLAQAVERAMVDKVLNRPDFSWMMWHSHNSMAVGWSTKDVEEQVHRMRDVSGVPNLFSMVGNHDHEYKVRLDLFDHPIIPHIEFDDIKLIEVRQAGLVEEARAEIEKHVVKQKPKWQKAGKATVTTTTTKKDDKAKHDPEADDDWLWDISEEKWQKIDWDSVDEAIKDGRVQGPEDLFFDTEIKMFVPRQDALLMDDDEGDDPYTAAIKQMYGAAWDDDD